MYTVSYILHPASPGGNIFNKYSIISKLENLNWYDSIKLQTLNVISECEGESRKFSIFEMSECFTSYCHLLRLL